MGGRTDRRIWADSDLNRSTFNSHDQVQTIHRGYINLKVQGGVKFIRYMNSKIASLATLMPNGLTGCC